jgi:hypothetical protein
MRAWAFVGLVSAGWAVLTPISQARPAPLCPTAATGRWLVTSYFIDNGIVAVTPKEMRRMIGRRVTISDQEVVFGSERCAVKSKEVIDDEIDQDSRDHGEIDLKSKGYPKYVKYSCSNSVYPPTFSFGGSCAKIIASGDGGYWVLKRIR